MIYMNPWLFKLKVVCWQLFSWLNGDNLIWFPVFYLTGDETQVLKTDIPASTVKPTEVTNLPMSHWCISSMSWLLIFSCIDTNIHIVLIQIAIIVNRCRQSSSIRSCSQHDHKYSGLNLFDKVAYTGLQTRGPGPLVYQGIAFEHYHKLGNSSQRYYKKVSLICILWFRQVGQNMIEIRFGFFFQYFMKVMSCALWIYS